MPAKKEMCSMLVVSKSMKMTELLRETMPMVHYQKLTAVKTAGEAKRLLLSVDYDIVVINTPLEDDYGIISAIDISRQYDCGILLLVKAEMYEQVSFKAEDYGIFTLSKPLTKQSLYSAVRLLCAMRIKIRQMSEETKRVKKQLNDIKLIDRAKWLLVDKFKMSEPEAHYYIEKQAMDRCIKKAEAAENILRSYEI